MQLTGLQKLHAVGDADVLIVLTSVRCSISRPNVLVGDDTDLLVLLYYHSSPHSLSLYFQPRPQMNQEPVFWDIHKLQKHLGEDVDKNIIFIHAVLGCDTTSKVYGKGFALRYFEKNHHYRNAASVFDMSPDEVSNETII